MDLESSLVVLFHFLLPPVQLEDTLLFSSPTLSLAHLGSMESGDYRLQPLQPRATRNPFLFSCPPWALSQQQSVSRMLGKKKNQDRSETQHCSPEVQGFPKRGIQGQALTIQSSIVPVTPDQLCTHHVKALMRVWNKGVAMFL